MNTRYLVVILLALVATGPAFAQQDTAIKAPEPDEVRVFYLRYISAADAAKVASQILDGMNNRLKMANEDRTNSLIVSGDRQALSMLEKVLEQLDRAGGEEDRRTVRKYPVKSQNASLAQRMLVTLLQGGDARFEVSGNSLIVYGNDKTHAQVEAILTQLFAKAPAQASERYYIHIVWVAGGGEAAKDWKLQKIPAPLKDLVEKKLAPRLSLEAPGMVGQILIAASVEGELAEVNASGSGNISEGRRFEMLCDAIVQKMDGGVKLDLDLRTVISPPPAKVPVVQARGASRGVSNNLNTTISLKLDHPVCLGTTPTNGVNSVFLIQVTKDLD